MPITDDLNKLMSEQAHASRSFLATLEPVEGDAARVKVTPYGNDGCGCDEAMTIAIDHLESVSPDGDRWHDCCGKRLRVARVVLKPEATVLASELLAAPRRTRARAAGGGGHVHPDLPTGGQHGLDCFRQEQRCIAEGHPYGWCHAYYQDCLERNVGPDVRRAAAGGGTDCYDDCVTAFQDCRNAGYNKASCAAVFMQCKRGCRGGLDLG